MLTEERFALILETVNKNRSVRLGELCELLNTSESTVRRDLSALAEKGLLTKVHGGAIAVGETFSPVEYNMEEKSLLYMEEKQAIAQYAAGLLENGDFVFIDAGTTTEKMIDFLPEKNAAFVTNGLFHAKKLAQKGFKVYVLAGELKLSTEAVVGTECVLALKNYNFTKSFIGTNGISLSCGLTTPDPDEASIKTAVISSSKNAYVLADHSKFDKITSVTFGQLEKVTIITDKLSDKRYLAKAKITEVCE